MNIIVTGVGFALVVLLSITSENLETKKCIMSAAIITYMLCFNISYKKDSK
jgi:hypothetical protein